MVELLKRCFPAKMSDWEPKLKEMLPGYGVRLNENPSLAAEVLSLTDRVLKLK
jgi:malate dehydrogenase (quinone)